MERGAGGHGPRRARFIVIGREGAGGEKRASCSGDNLQGVNNVGTGMRVFK